MLLSPCFPLLPSKCVAEPMLKIRADLVYTPDPADEDRFFIKDPVRREFFRFNELQVEMMQALDGKRTLEDVCDYLEEMYDAEIPIEGVERFVKRLEQNYLLDVTSYHADDEKTRKEIWKALRKRDLTIRARARDGSSPEGQLFEAATREIHEGDPCLAAHYLTRVLEINPRNQRAREILVCIQDAFFRSKTATISHAKLIHVFNPDRLLGAIDRVAGRFIFGSLGVLVGVAIIIWSIPAAVESLGDLRFLSGFGVFDVFVAIGASLFAGTFHELSHGLACKHYGGRVDDVGLMFLYGISPSAYCDTSDSYTFSERRHKIVVQLAGIFGHLLIQALIYQLLVITDPTFPLWRGLLISQILWLIPTIKNLIPLVKFDGYYALSDYLQIANLRERSLGYVRDRLQLRLFGVVPTTPEPTPRERRIFFIFGTLTAIYTALFIYGLWISFLLPFLIRTLGVVGLIITIIFFTRLLGFVLLRYLIQFARFVFRERRQIFTLRRSIAFTVVGAALAAVMVAPWPLHIDGAMKIEPRRRATVRVFEAGLLEDLQVVEGQWVEAGQVLALLRSDQLSHQLALAEAELDRSHGELEMLRRGSRSEEISLANAQTRAKAVIRLAANAEVAQALKARELDVGSDEAVLRASERASRTAGELGVTASKRDLMLAGSRAEEVVALEASVRQQSANLDELEDRVARLEIRSPIDGVVVASRLAERSGEWLEVGESLVEIHDMSKWRVRVTPDPGQPLSGIARGQKLKLRALGDPHGSVISEIAQVLPPASGEESPVIESVLVQHLGWRSGMSGNARIYTPPRSVGYRLVVLPVVRLLDFELPAL